MKQASKSAIAGGNVASNTSMLIRGPSGSEKTVDEIKTQTVLNYIIQRMLHLQEFFSSFIERCNNKSLDLIALL